MNDDQLEACFKNLKSNVREPDQIDAILEERVMNLSGRLKKNRRRTKRFVATLALLFVAGTSFVALGGDSVLMNYIAPSTVLDDNGTPVRSHEGFGKWLRSFHDHVWEHFRMLHGKPGSSSKS